MHPILFQFGKFRISMYGVMVATAFIVSLTYLVRNSRKNDRDPNLILDLAYYVLIAGILGSRLFYVAVNYKYYLSNPLAILKIWEGGLVFYGALIGSFLTFLWYVHRHALDFWGLADFLVPAVPLGHVFGRLGCFFAGCCYGKPAPELPWAITFHDSASLAPKDIPLHPSQLYSSLGAFVIFVLLVFISRTKKFDGQVFISYLLLYPIARIVEEQFRGDFERKFLPLSWAPQLISTGILTSIIIFVIGLILLGIRARNAPNARA